MSAKPCRLADCAGHPEMPEGWTSWQEALHADDGFESFHAWPTTEPIKRAESMGHTVEPDPPVGAFTSGYRWTCTRRECGRAVLIVGHNIYGSAVAQRCEPRLPSA